MSRLHRPAPALHGMHTFAVVEQRFNWLLWRPQVRILSTHHTTAAAVRRAGEDGRDHLWIVRTTRCPPAKINDWAPA